MKRLISTLMVLALSWQVLPVQAQEKAHPFLQANATSVFNATGQPESPNRLLTRKYTLIYFSAHWCPPCRAFTPQLVQFYQQNGGGDKFEIVFVSSDKSAEAMWGYMKEMKMNWVAVPWNSASAKAFKTTYGGPGIPCLVLLNENDVVISHSFEGRKYVGPHKVLQDLAQLLAQK